jgi:putative transposase
MEGESNHRRQFRRFNESGHARYLTFSCYKRLPLLNNDAIRALFLERLDIVRREHRVRLLAWVIMPEHVHLLVFPDGDADMGRFSHAIKRPVAEKIVKRWKALNAPILGRIRHGEGYRFWQTGGGYDRSVFTVDELLEKVEYIRNNPVRRGLAATPTDYAWSSARWYAGLPDPKIACDPAPF